MSSNTMKSSTMNYDQRVRSFLSILTLAASAALASGYAIAAEEGGEFSKTKIDIGVVVSDIEKSVKFYTEAIGFQEVKGFSVSADYSTDAGLTDGQPLEVRVLVLGEGEGATALKLMALPGAESEKGKNDFIHSQLGFRYLTLHVTDTTKAMARLKKAGVKPIGNTPSLIPESIAKDMYLTIVRDPDGNMVELVGPKK
jgi:catechol 2,3-dioxygenase-like lactoylglutathione lyase family enzyme